MPEIPAQRKVGHEPTFCFGSGKSGVSARTEELQSLLSPVVEALGYQLWGLELLAQGRHSLLRVYIDSEAGITVDDCAAVSRHVSSALDVADPIHGAYTLEVSSPGWDRPLFTKEQYEQFVGEVVNVRLARSIQGRRNCRGRLLAVDGNGIELELEPEHSLSLPFTAIKKANLVVDDE